MGGRADEDEDAGPGPVVVGVDGSAASLTAVEAAADEARRRGAALRLTYVLTWSDRVPVGVPPWDPDGDGLRETVAEVLTRAEDRARRVAPRLTIVREVLLGEPGAVLAAESRDACLTVIGRRPGPVLTARGPGRTTGRLTARGGAPVLVVCGRPGATGPVVLSEDGSPAAREAAGFAFAEAAARGADLEILHLPGGRRPGRGHRATTAELAALRKRHPDVTVRSRWIRHRPRRALTDASAGAGLVVVGAGRGPAGHPVLRHAYCPVAVVPGIA
ncbi:universal stress protein [Streptomyces mangrovisoli]|uniref:UspA domain-containing protein n=1 Tax=Streptomyces mangrovisoli TaxID=1428628 RepID=A0A1J4P4I9_9ACTN|nr:universal stress protein [Streptomyces mangrovisoli]OIJ68684.1 hypothetical protein WN71_006520 [Streptomyces mangrovisoli]